MIALLADVGGTKTQLALMNQAGELIAESLVVNADYDCFETVIEQFLRQQPPPTAAVLAVAGPVDNAIRCQMTNLNWLIDGEHLQRHYNLSRVTVLNDLQATAWGLTSPALRARLEMLRGESLNFHQPVVVISPGTGLGQACIIPHQGTFIIQGTEGGHKTFAPFSRQSAELLHRHWQQHDYAPSWENWFSGSGFGRLYESLFPGESAPDNDTLGSSALADPSGKAAQCMQLFTQAVYAEAGNLALQYLAWGGIIVAGGIPPKLGDFFRQQEHIHFIDKKNEYIDRLRAIPVALSHAQDVPIKGAAEFCKQHLRSD
ncbi:MAG: ROK family protein [Ketobacter sp.]|uniref:glucokinase n=1 Tax=unclassified Ketobacter TaxID=2639109 RepID=UPI0025BBBDD8|nr:MULTISPECIES: ROK family protein [unclassified Ketobacter]MEC8813122.1 ROK family protein [Pseudomonadota bacterium]